MLLYIVRTNRTTKNVATMNKLLTIVVLTLLSRSNSACFLVILRFLMLCFSLVITDLL